MTTTHSRRTVLRATGAALVGASISGCLTGGQLGSADADDTEADATVTVGPGGDLTFEPQDVSVRPGRTVAWEWKSNNHNVVVESQPDGASWEGTGSKREVFNDGYRYTHTFEVPGEYEYVCHPHRAAGMTGSVTVSSAGTSETTTETTTDEAKPPATADDLPVEVAPNDEYGFRPGTERPLKVPAGTEVTFVWKSDTHDIVVESQPDGADWEGTPGSDTKTYDTGYEHSHTFEVPGKYEYYCMPHEALGLGGTIIVE